MLVVIMVNLVVLSWGPFGGLFGSVWRCFWLSQVGAAVIPGV